LVLNKLINYILQTLKNKDMKRALVLFMLTTFTLISFAQSNPIDKMFDKYAGKDGCTTVYISSKMFSLIARADFDDEEMEELMNNLKSIRILTVEDSLLNKKINFHDELQKSLDFSNYEELMVVKDGEKDLKFLIKEKGKRIEELLMIGGGDDGGNILLSIKGDLDLDNIANISSKIGIEQLEELEKKDNKKKDD